MSSRRDVLITIGATAFAPRAVFSQPKQGAPAAAGAQPAATLRRIGILSTGSTGNSNFDELRKALSELGHHDGKNLKLEYHIAEGKYERYRRGDLRGQHPERREGGRPAGGQGD
jgi:hypothetical protein